MRRFPFLLAAATAAMLLSCDSGEGSFTMSFNWETPPDGKVWIWVRVEERTEATQTGPILASAGPVEYETGKEAALEMPEVSNGANRYVIAEVRESTNANQPVLYYGISDPFELVAGKHTHVDVAMELQTPEAKAVEAKAWLEFAGKTKETVGVSDLHNATVVLESANAVSVVIANDASFAADTQELPLNTATKMVMVCEEEEKDGLTWDICRLDGWDLAPEGELQDQQYTVFVKFVDQYGYESQVYRASVVLDSQGPQVLLGTLTPPITHPGADVVVSVTFHEALAETPKAGILTVKPDLPENSQVAGPTVDYLVILTEC